MKNRRGERKKIINKKKRIYVFDNTE